MHSLHEPKVPVFGGVYQLCGARSKRPIAKIQRRPEAMEPVETTYRVTYQVGDNRVVRRFSTVERDPAKAFSFKYGVKVLSVTKA